ncbi:Aspartate aminotransferase, cytoplasmic, partial [Cladochytrium tenue]
RWHHVDEVPGDHVFEVFREYVADPRPEKINVTIGAYRDELGRPWVLPSVRKAISAVTSSEKYTHEYNPIEGDPTFIEAAQKLLLGAQNRLFREKKVVGVQTVSGTGAVRVGAEFLRAFLPPGTAAYVSDPSWPNHHAILRQAGFEVRSYPYWRRAGAGAGVAPPGLDMDGLLAALRAAPAGSVVVLHACAHNPTGVDPTREQWARIADVIEERRLVPFFDIAYQGFASGDADADAWAVRYFATERGFEVMVAQSFSKNFGLY